MQIGGPSVFNARTPGCVCKKIARASADAVDRRLHDFAPAPASLPSSAGLLCACIAVPRTVQVCDPECRVQVRHITLEAAQLASFRRRANEGCLMLLAASAIVAAASGVISGSIAVIGNAVYWSERQGGCQTQP